MLMLLFTRFLFTEIFPKHETYLIQDIDVNSVGKSNCDFTTCAAAPTASLVEAFASSNDAWTPEFTFTLLRGGFKKKKLKVGQSAQPPLTPPPLAKLGEFFFFFYNFFLLL